MKNPSIDDLLNFLPKISKMFRDDGLSQFEFINDPGMFLLENYEVELCKLLGIKPIYKLYSYKNKRMRRNRHDPIKVLEYIRHLEKQIEKQGLEIPYTNEGQRKDVEEHFDFYQKA